MFDGRLPAFGYPISYRLVLSKFIMGEPSDRHLTLRVRGKYSLEFGTKFDDRVPAGPIFTVM
jgi:hypothetical protein